MRQEAQEALAEFYGEMKWHFQSEGQIIREHAWYAQCLAKCLRLGVPPKLVAGIEDRIVNEQYMDKENSYLHSVPEEAEKIAA